MKKNIYLVFALLSFSTSMATQNVTTSFVIASSLVLSKTSENRTLNKRLSLDLHKAIHQRDYTSAQKLINNPQVDVNTKVDYGTYWWQKGITPLIMCCQQGDKSFKIATSLLAHRDIEVNLQKEDGTTPLIMCCTIGDESFKIARALLGRKDIEVNLKDNSGWTPLIWCSAMGDKSFKIVKALLARRDIKVNLQNNWGATPLIRCAWEADESFKIVKALLARRDIDINLQDDEGYTPLDNIIYWIKGNKENYTYVKVWNILVAKGGILNEYKNDYQNLRSQDLKEPHRTYVHLIKQRPPRNCTNNHFMYSEEEIKEDV